MKKRHLVYAIALIVGMGACAASAKKQEIGRASCRERV